MSRILKFQFPLTALAFTAMLVFASPAFSSEASTIVSRCTHGESLTGFKQKAYRKALRDLSTEVSEYSNCEELIHKAQLSDTGSHQGPGAGTGGGGISASGAPPISPLPVTPTEQRAIARAHHSGSHPVSVGNKLVTPGVVHANISSAVSSLPTPLLALLAFLLAGALSMTGLTLRGYVRTRSHP
jgi:hypothetical protein